jgi:hypothetical protein
MLRLAILCLLFANAAFFAWAQGLLRPWGLAPVQQSEPQRLEQQIRPQALRVVGLDEARRLAVGMLPADAQRLPECLASGPLEDTQAGELRKVLASWPAGSWRLEASTEPARWIVYMGKYASAESVERKKAELRWRGVSFEPLANRALEPGLSLGGFATAADARHHLELLAQRGVRTASVMQERPELRGTALRLPAVDDSLRARLEPLRTVLGPQALRPCR